MARIVPFINEPKKNYESSLLADQGVDYSLGLYEEEKKEQKVRRQSIAFLFTAVEEVDSSDGESEAEEKPEEKEEIKEEMKEIKTSKRKFWKNVNINLTNKMSNVKLKLNKVNEKMNENIKQKFTLQRNPNESYNYDNDIHYGYDDESESDDEEITETKKIQRRRVYNPYKRWQLYKRRQQVFRMHPGIKYWIKKIDEEPNKEEEKRRKERLENARKQHEYRIWNEIRERKDKDQQTRLRQKAALAHRVNKIHQIAMRRKDMVINTQLWKLNDKKSNEYNDRYESMLDYGINDNIGQLYEEDVLENVKKEKLQMQLLNIEREELQQSIINIKHKMKMMGIEYKTQHNDDNDENEKSGDESIILEDQEINEQKQKVNKVRSYLQDNCLILRPSRVSEVDPVSYFRLPYINIEVYKIQGVDLGTSGTNRMSSLMLNYRKYFSFVLDINLRNNNIKSLGLIHFRNGLAGQSWGIKTIDLSFNGINDKGIEVLCESIGQNELPNLKSLDLRCNLLTNKSCRCLASNINTDHLLYLTNLNLSGNKIHDEGARNMLDSVIISSQLYVYLNRNFISSEFKRHHRGVDHGRLLL